MSSKSVARGARKLETNDEEENGETAEESDETDGEEVETSSNGRGSAKR